MTRDEFIDLLFQDGNFLTSEYIDYLYSITDEQFADIVTWYKEYGEYTSVRKQGKNGKQGKPKIKELEEEIRYQKTPITREDIQDFIIDLGISKGVKDVWLK